MRPYRYSWLSLLGSLAFSGAVTAEDPGAEFFEKKIRPILVEHCYECHATGAKKVRGELLLDSRPAILKGGASGPALLAGHPEKSLLIKAVLFQTEDMKMPPKGKLPASAIADLETWIKMGAPDPRDKATRIKPNPPWEEVVRQRKDWWSLRPPKKSALPSIKEPGPMAPVDQFILSKLEEKKLKLAIPAPPSDLIRRLSLVLTGLPPTTLEISVFEKRMAEKGSEIAVRELTDRLLASPHFGERWARHWMDVVRFSETHGNEWNYEVHHAWRYRDYLIRAFNADVPYDQFIREHLAGDLLHQPRWNKQERFNESVIGTAFWRFGEVNHDDCITLPQIGYDLADNQIDTMSKAFQAMTVACARCHDHKLDAVSMRDYYGVLGVLRSSRFVSHTLDGPEVNADILEQMRGVKQSMRAELAGLWKTQVDSKRIEKWLSAKVMGANLPDENPLSAWQQMMTIQKAEKLSFREAAKKVAERLAREDEHAQAREKEFIILADFRNGIWPNWQVGGQGLRGLPARAGDFVVAPQGDKAVSEILPAGAFTHSLSSILNGTLRSPTLTRELTQEKRWISFRVMGKSASAVRLVSNNCQLNYANYRALTKGEWQWVTFKLPEERDSLNVYAELMTKFDNPKFPDQLGTLGGDTKNDRIPWEQAAADPQSHFGVSHVVLHDNPSPPKPDRSALREIVNSDAVSSMEDFGARLTHRLEAAMTAWQRNNASDTDARWIEAFVEQGYLYSNATQSPHLAELLKQYRALEAKLQIPRIVPGIAESGREFSQAIFTRGDCLKPGEKVSRSFVAAVSPKPFLSAGSGRLELADRIATRDNPLTARVIVNRIWHHLFGSGLVRTVDDFGHVGDIPSHPELLDYLADQFVDEGWSIKRLIREIVLTHTFQSSHEPSHAALEADPENRLLQRYPARRMEAEAIRDALLFASGRLDRTLYGMSVPAFRERDDDYHRLFRGPLDGNGRRSLYIKATLMEAPAFLENFNIPGGKVTQGRRDATNVPAQALAMLNDPLVRDQAAFWGKRLVERKDDSVEERIGAMFMTALGRDPSTEETSRFGRFAERLAELHWVPKREILRSQAIWSDMAHTLFNLQEFIVIP